MPAPQAMGRSRTMNDTLFTIYKSGIEPGAPDQEVCDIKQLELTRQLYVRNCDQKMAGNLSSVYQTLISLLNLSLDKFYYVDEIVNVFLEKMESTISKKVERHEQNIARYVFGKPVPSGILTHILGAKFQKSSNPVVANEAVTEVLVKTLLQHIVQQKYEQRMPTQDIYDDFIRFLSGEQEHLMEISYTKQQQKQKQKQSNKNQDSDTMAIFDKKNQLLIAETMDNYFEYTLAPEGDITKLSLSLPLAKPILKLAYGLGGTRHYINIYPTLQFLYSHHIQPEFIDDEIREILKSVSDTPKFCKRFCNAVRAEHEADQTEKPAARENSTSGPSELEPLDVEMLCNYIKQNPQYTLAALQKGVYVIGMKEQFNIHDLPSHPMQDEVQYVADEMGFILFDRTGSRAAGGGPSAGRSTTGAMNLEGAPKWASTASWAGTALTLVLPVSSAAEIDANLIEGHEVRSPVSRGEGCGSPGGREGATGVAGGRGEWQVDKGSTGGGTWQVDQGECTQLFG